MLKTIIIIILVLICAGLVIWGIISKGADTATIDDLESTIESYRESVERLEATNQQLENTIGELQEYRDRLVDENNRLESTIEEISDIISGADENISDALETAARIRELSEQIEN